VAYGRYDPEKVTHLFGGIELRHGNAPQFDLGTLEMMFTVLVAVLFALTWRKKIATGSYVAAVALAYAPVRFAMDFLRIHGLEEIADPRYFYLTPAQWACVALFVFGVVMVVVVRKISASGRDPLDMLLPPPESPLPAEGAYRESA
jgi:phosphatidylglycerol:prolipoprotein diacylglycerol transferase